MKKYSRLILLLTTLSSVGQAAPFLAIGDGAELFATGTLGVRADDNIFLSNKTKSDTIFDINPGLTLDFGKNADLKGSLAIVDAFANYTDNSSLNTSLFSGDFNANYDDGKTKLNFIAGYHELNQNTVDTGSPIGGGLVRRDQFNASAKGEVEISQISSVALAVNFDHANYKHKGYGDSDTLLIPIAYYYKWTPKTELSFGYRYRNFQTQLGQDSIDHFISVGACGELLPLLKGEISVGYNKSNISGGGSKSDPAIDGKVTYEFSLKTTFDFNISSDYSTTPQGIQQKNFTLGGKVNIAIDSTWSVNGGLTYRSIDYYSRKDDYMEFTLGAGYVVNSYVKLNAGYTYRNNSSKLAGSEFTNNVFSLSANFRY